MPPTAAEFIETLERSKLLSASQLADARSRLAAGTAPLDLAEDLATRGELTAWQAEQLLSGRHAFFLGRYKLLEQLGGGGMGVVFKAHHAMTSRTVALKVMSKAVLANPAALVRFQREVRVISALNHPNIITALDADCVNDTHFLVMEFGQGRDLKAWIKEFGRLPVDWSCECIRQAALGLQHAHERGLVHRDIKPDNLLVDVDPKTGRPVLKILDMGLARLDDDAGDAEITHSGQILGTPDYISPEQAEETRRADIRSDIFSLGCTLFKLLTGEVPFAGEDAMEKLLARVTQDAPRLRSLRSDLPPGLDEIVARMLAREPEDRYQIPAEVVAALTPYAAGDKGSWDETMTLSAPTSPPVHVSLQPDRTPASFLSQLTSRADSGDPAGSGLTVEIRRERLGPAPVHTGWLTGAAVATLAVVLLLFGWYWFQSRPAVLELAWPIDERQGARLDIDDRRVRLPADDPALILLKPGPHQVYVRRRGFEPIEWKINIKRGQRLRRVVDWEELDLGMQSEKGS